MKSSSLLSWLSSIAAVFTFSVSQVQAQEVYSLDQLIKIAFERSEAFKSIDQSVLSLGAEIGGREIELSPRFTSELGMIKDQRDTLSATRTTDSRFFTASLTKLFSTGTTLTLSAGQDAVEINPTGPQTTAEWEARVSQSLWRNSFGRATRLRRESDQGELKSRRLLAEYERQNLILNLEDLYWDLALAYQEEKVLQGNTDRSGRLEKWIRDRVSRSVAERTDLFQAQALTSDRKLELLSAQNRIVNAQTQIVELLPGINPSDLRVQVSLLEQPRPLESLLLRGEGTAQPARLDSIAAMFASKQAKAQAERASDSVSPLLDVYAAHGRNGIRGDSSAAWSRASGPDYYASEVGVLFSVDLDWTAKRNVREAAKYNAEAREFEAQARARSSTVEWNELSRNISQLKLQVDEAKRKADFYRQNTLSEQKRYQLGKSTAFQAITVEITAANAEVDVYRRLNLLRKAEARARLFTRDTDGDL